MPGSTGQTDREASTAEQTGPSLRKHLRDIAFIAGFVGVAYTVLRYLKSRENGRPLREAISDSAEDEHRADEPIEIDIPETEAAPDDSSSETRTSSDTDSETATRHDESVVTDDETPVELADDERSIEEIEERSEPDVQEEPAEPGEMAVDDDLADELVDDADELAEETDTDRESSDD